MFLDVQETPSILYFTVLLFINNYCTHHTLQFDCCHGTNYTLSTLTYSRESEINDATHYRESFMEVMDEIED